VQTLVLVGHNPAIAQLANSLADKHGDAAAMVELARGYPASGVAVFVTSTPWRQVQAGTAALTHFAAPPD
jgi:phosphohistidine phosphatase